MTKFNINQLLSKKSLEDKESYNQVNRKELYKIKMISVHDLVPSEDNFYSLNQIEELKTAIELVGGIKQNLNVVPIENNKYKVLAGHRRRLASLALTEEGKKEYEFVPCKVEDAEEDEEMQNIQEELLIILTNSHREKTDFDKVEEVRRLRELLEEYKKKEKIPGRMREIIAEALNTSPGQVGRMESIDRKLSEEFKEEFKEENINISTAYQLSTLPEEGQKDMYKDYKEKGSLSINEVKEKKIKLKQPEPMQEIKDIEEAAADNKEKIDHIENEKLFPTVYETIKEKDIRELATFICSRCQKWGRFCDFAIECNQSKEEDRIDICTNWLMNQTERVVDNEEESN